MIWVYKFIKIVIISTKKQYFINLFDNKAILIINNIINQLINLFKKFHLLYLFKAL